jgi:trans-aconitate 2-methyltransferase
VAADAWDPAQYARFQAERAQPFFDLLALVRPRPGMRVVDLGCGSGELTQELHRRLGAAATLGVDNSEAMLAKARPLAGAGLAFAAGDLASFMPATPCDLVFSNAAIHWVADHPALLARLTSALSADGQLAVQVPANHDHPSHVVAEEVAAEAPFLDALGDDPAPRRPVLAPEEYAVLLDRLGCREQHVRLQV